jgi:hypothetical protein
MRAIELTSKAIVFWLIKLSPERVFDEAHEDSSVTASTISVFYVRQKIMTLTVAEPKDVRKRE